MGNGRNWSASDEKLLEQLHNSGWSHGELSEVLDRSYAAVVDKLYRMGILVYPGGNRNPKAPSTPEKGAAHGR